MNEKGLMTFEQAPWVEYLEIDEKTGERRLRKDTPKDIRIAYEKYLVEKINKRRPIAK